MELSGILVVKEANVSLVSGDLSGPSLLWLVELLLPGWYHWRSTCVDVTGVSPFGCSTAGSWVELGTLA